MRALVYLLVLAWPISAAADTYPIDMRSLPNPPGCADYMNVTGGVADDACNDAIARETDPGAKSMMLFRRAFIEDAPGDFNRYPAALADLDLSIKLYPKNWPALHERAYLYVEYGRWADARADLDAEIALHENPSGYRERALARFHLGDLEGAYADRDATIRTGDDTPASRLGRATAAMWLGKFAEAQQDIDAAALAAKSSGDTKGVASADAHARTLKLWSTTSAKPVCETPERAPPIPETLIGDCTREFLDAKTPAARSAALTVRSIAWLFTGSDIDARTADLQIAAALDPKNASAHSNLAFAYIGSRHSFAASEEFDRAIALEQHYLYYAGRASARFNLGQVDGAESDARTSMALQKNELAYIVLGDIAYFRTKSYDDAKGYWISAYRLGVRDDSLIARLKAAGVPIPPPNSSF